MFEDMTYEKILSSVLANAPESIDTRQGSIFYDAVSGICLLIAKQYIDLDNIFRWCFVSTATGDYLDERATEYGLTRQAAQPTSYRFVHEGVTPSLGTRFFHNDSGYYFYLDESHDGDLLLTAETAGAECNYIPKGDPAIPVNAIQGLISAQFGELYVTGLDTETDDSLRTRILEKIANPSENGNKQNYKTWCEEVQGVGIARIFPLWNGPNTVKAVLINSLGLPCDEETVAEVQEYIDPATKGYVAVVDGVTYVVGDGLGEGVANLGAHFTAAAAVPCTIDIDVTIEAHSGYSLADIADEITTAVSEYFRDIVFGSDDDSDEVVIRLTSIGAIIAELRSVADYSNLTLNGGTANIYPGEDEVPVIGEVTVT